MRYVETIKARPIEIDDEQRTALEQHLSTEIEDALSSRQPLESIWRDLLRQYEGVPKNPTRNFPIENAPNIEVTLGAICVDSIYAQIDDLIGNSTPLLTCRPVPEGEADQETVADAKALQRFANHIAASESGLKEAGDDAILDDVKLGTGVFYIPWTEKRKKTKTSRILNRSPRIRAHPLEDYIVTGGSYGDPNEIPMVALRFYRTAEEVKTLAKRNNWNTLSIAPCAARGWVRNRREALGRHVQGLEAKGNMYELFDIYLYYDIDGDGENEDLYIVWDRTSRSILKVAYNPYDCRPVSVFHYQRREHMSYGIGVLQMVQPYEEAATEINNFAILNAMLANCRVIVTKTGATTDTVRLWPGKNFQVADPKNDFNLFPMADVYPSILQMFTSVTMLAERRVGVNEMSMPRASAVMGTRTPGITALSMLQQVNKRFTPAFKGVRFGVAGAVRQCLYRYQERAMANDAAVYAHIQRVVGVEDGQRVWNVLRQPTFDEHISIELTASSASVNAEADRQNAMMLVTILGQYYQRSLELVTLAANPQTPPEVAQVAKQIAEKAGEIIDRTIRTFDQVRDPGSFILQIEDEIDSAMENAPQQAIMQLLTQVGGAAAQQQPGGLPAPAGGNGGGSQQ